MQFVSNSDPKYNIKKLVVYWAAWWFYELVKIPSFEKLMRRQPDLLYEIACKGTR